jgi:hypothetical protein
MKQEPKRKQFAFRPSKQALSKFKDASPEAKLNWLEEANRFVNDFVPSQKLGRWKKIVGR